MKNVVVLVLMLLSGHEFTHEELHPRRPSHTKHVAHAPVAR